MLTLFKSARALALAVAILPALSCTTTLAAPSSRKPAAVGGFNGGGGNELIAQFVSVAQELLLSVPFTANDKQLLSSALASVKITTVPVLLDPTSGQPIPNQDKLIAWGSPGAVQLKTKSADPNADSFESAVESGRIISYVIVHELYRASGVVDASGKSPDETFQVSIGVYHLDKNATGAALSNGSQFYLYAECKIASCETNGFWPSPTIKDGICTGETSQFPKTATLQIYKYAGLDQNQQHDGYFGVNVLTSKPEARIGNEGFYAVNIQDGSSAMQIIAKGQNAFRNFNINYAPKGGVSTGHAEIEFIRPWRSWVTLNLSNCHTE